MTEKRFINRLDKSNVKFNTLNPVWDNEKEDALNVFKMVDLLNELNDENEKLKTQLMENNCDNCEYSKAIYADVECRKKGLTEWKYNCDEFKGDRE